MDNTYDYSALWDEIAEDVESGLTDRLNKIDFESIIKKALSRYHLKMEDIDWDSKAFQLALSKGLYEAINGVKKQVKADLGDFDIANYMKISPDALNAKIKTTFKNMTETLKEYGKEAAQEFTDEFFQAMTVARVRKIKLPDKVKEKWEDAYNDLMDELRIGLGGKDTGEYKIGSDLDAKYTKASQTYQEWYIAIQDRIEEYKSTVEIAKKVVNTIRQTLPKNASEDQVRDVVNGLLESSGSGIAKTQQSLKELDETVKELGNEVADQHISDAYKELFEEIKKVGNVAGLDVTNEKLRKSLEELKLIGKEAENLTLVNQGYTNEGGIIGEDKVVLLRKNTEENLQNSQELMGKLEEAYKRGVNVARIIDVINDGSKVFMEVQEKMSGKTLGNHVDVINWDFLDATEEQINRFAEDIKKLQDLSVGVDINLSNIFYDKDKGFGFIDLDLQPAMYEGLEDFLHDARGGIVGEIEDECAEMNKDLEKIPLAENFFNKFAEGFKGSLNVHSPSKETAKIADNVVDGFVEEIDERLPEVEKVGEKLGDAVKDGIKNSLQGAAIDEDDIDAILGKKDIANQLGYAIKDDNELPEWAEQEAEQAIENLEEMHQEAEKTEKAMSRVMEIWKEFGTPSDALDAGRFERVQEALDYLGGKFAEMNTEADDFSEHKLNAAFYKELIKELDLTEDQLTVVKGLIEDIYTLAPGGRFAHLYTPANASKFIFGELDKIRGILNGEYQITDKDLKDAKIVLESIQSSVEETTQTEVQMGKQGEVATEQITEGLKEVQEEAEKTIETLQQVGDKLSIVGYHGTAKKWKGDAFDVNQTRAAQLGSGMYFVDSPEKLEGFLSRPGSGDIKKTELNLERCFMLTKDYISSIEDINKILGTTFDETTESKEVISAIRNFAKASKANSLSFRQSMLDLGYQGLYAGDNLANKKIDNELVVYDESLLQNLETINKADFQSLLNNVDDVTQAEVQMGEQGEIATEKIKEGLEETKKTTQELVEEWRKLNQLLDNVDAQDLSKLNEIFAHMTNIRDSLRLKDSESDVIDNILSNKGYTTERAAQIIDNLHTETQSEIVDQTNKKILNGNKLREDCYEILGDIGLTEDEFIIKLQRETEEIKAGNRAYQERFALIKDGQVIQSFAGNEHKIALYANEIAEDYDKAIHTHPPNDNKYGMVNGFPSSEDLEMFLSKYQDGIREFVLYWNNSILKLELPAFLQNDSMFFQRYNKVTDAILSLTDDKDIATNYGITYLISQLDELGIKFQYINSLGENLSQQRIKPKDFDIISKTVADMQDDKYISGEITDDDLLERGLQLSNTFDILSSKSENFKETIIETEQNLAKEIEKANAALEEQKQQIAELEGQNESLRSSLQAQGDELQHAYEEQGSLQMDLDSAESTSKMLEDDLNKQKQITAELEAQVESEKQLRKEAETNAKFYEEMSHMAAGGEASADERARQEAEARIEVEKTLKSEQDKLALIEQENQALKEQANIQQEKLNLAEKERAYYEEAANNGEREITNLENQLKQKQAQDETLNKQVSELDEKNKALTEVNQNLQKELQVEKEVNAQKTSSAAKVGKKEVDNVDKLADALRSVIDAVNEKTEAFKKEQSVVKEVVKSEVGDVAALKGAVDDVSKARKTNQQNKQQQAKNTENEKIKEVLKYYEQLEKTEQRYQYLIAKRDISNKDLSVQEAMQLQKLQTQRDLEQERLLTLKEITKEVRAAQESYKHIAEMENQNASGATRSALIKNIEDQISKTQAKIDSGKYTQLSSNAVQTRLNNVKNANFDEANVEQLQTYVQLLEEMNKQFVRAGNNTKLTKLLGEVNQVLADNSKLSRDLKAQFANLGTQFESALQTGSSQEEVQALTRRFLELKTEMIKTGQSGKSFFGMIKNDITQASARMIAQYMSFQDWIRYIRQAVSAVTDLNTALNQLKIISGSTDSALSHVAQDAYNLANELGMSTTEVVSSITEWRRLGKTIDESMILAEQAARLSTGGIMDINEATTALISSMQAFEMGADEASKIVDQYIYLGNNYAISSSELATSLTKSMAALKVAGNSLEEIEALEVAGNAMVQDADVVSNSLKVLSLRLRGTTGSALEEIGEDTEGLIEDFSKLNNKIRDLTKTASNPAGVSIVDKMTGGYKSTYQVLLEIAKVWNEIGDMQKAEILETVAGKTRATAAAAILESPELLEKAYADAMTNAAGAGKKAVDVSMESIEKRANVLKNDLRQLAIEAIDSKGIVNIIDTIDDMIVKIKDSGSDLMPVIDALTNVLNLALKVFSIAPVGGLVGGILTAKGAFGKDTKINQLLSGKLFKAITPQALVSNSDLQIVTAAVDGVDTLAESYGRLNEVMVKLSPETQLYVQNLMKADTSSQSIIQSLKGQQEAARKLTIAQGALNAVLSVASSLIISGLIQGINYLIHREETLRKETAESLRLAKERTKVYEEQIAKVDEFIEKYDEYYKVIKDTTSSEEELYSARSNLYDLQKDVIDQFGETVKGIDMVNGSYKETLKILKDINAENRTSYLADNASRYSKALEDNLKDASQYILSPINNSRGSQTLLSEIFKAYGYDEAKLTAEEYKKVLEELIVDINDESEDVIKDKLNALIDFSDKSVWDGIGYYTEGRVNQSPLWFKEIVDAFGEAVQNEDSTLNNLINGQDFIREYEKALTLNDSQYSATYEALIDAYEAMQEARLKNDREAFIKAQNEFQSLYQSQAGIKPDAVQHTYNDLFFQAEELINTYFSDLEASQANVTDIVDLMFKSIEKGFNPKRRPEEYLTELNDILQKSGMTWEELTHEIELAGYNIDGFIKKYNEAYSTFNKISFSDWLGVSSSFKKDDKSLLNSELLKEYESAIGQFKDFLVNDREGKTEIALSDILTVTGDPEGFFKAIGMPNFEEYMKKFGHDTSLSMLAYMSEVGRKVKDAFGGDLNTEGLQNLQEQMQKMMLEATGFDPSVNVHKIEESYRELTHLGKLVSDGYQFSSDRMDELIEKYPELKSGIDTVTKSINTETGEVEATYTIQQSAIDGLISEYATLSNEAIDAWRIIKRETLEASIANLNNLLSLERIFELYHQVVDNQDYRGENVFGVNTGEITELVRQYEKEMQLLDDLKKNPGTNYFYKTNQNPNDDGNGDEDEDNKSQIDWLEQYLEKRNRLVDETQKRYDQLKSTIIETNNVESDYYDKRAKAMETANAALEAQQAAYKVAEDEYEKRMTSGLLYENLVKAAKSKDAANAYVKKIMAGEDINLEELESDLQSAITALVTNWNNKRDAKEKQIEIGVQIKENNLAQMKEDVERVVNKYDRILKEYEQRQKELEHYQTMQTTEGLMQNEQYIIALIDNESKALADNIKKRDTLTAELKSFIPTTENELLHWYDLKNQIDETTSAIYENQEAIASWQNEVKKLEWELDDKIMEMKYAVTDEAEFLMNNLDNSDMYKYIREFLGNDAVKTKLYNGDMSDEGLATLAMRFTKRKAYYEQIKEYDKQIAEAQALYEKDTANTENLDRLNDLIKRQREVVNNYNDEKQAILDLVREGYDKQLESLQSLIDKYMEALNAEKDLYDYQKNMEKQTKNIANLRKQMSAYANDTSEEARNRLQQLTVQLQEAEEGRADTEYSRHLQDQQDILDRMYQSLEDYFNDKMEDTDTILQESKKLVQDNVPAIKDILANSLSFSKTAQVAVSNSLNNILNDGINHVAQNIVNTEGDIQAVKDSVLGSTISLENYLANHDLDKQKKEDLYKWINNINTQANSFNTNLQELAKAFDAQISQAMGETDKDQRLSNVISTISPAVTTAASVMKNMGTIVTTQGAILEKYSSAAASAGVSLSEAVNDNMFKLYTAYNSGQSLVDAIKSVYKLPSNVTYNLAINLDNVTDYQSFIEECKRSKQFETLIQTMTLDTMNGQSNSLKKLNI